MPTSRARMTVNLAREDFDLLRLKASQTGLSPGSLAAQLISAGLRTDDGCGSTKTPIVALFEWLRPRLDALRQQGGWPATVSIDIFDAIARDALPLYRVAEADMGQSKLNQEIGRFIRDGLGARPVTDVGKPRLRRVRRTGDRLVTGVTLLEPDPDQ